MAAAEATEIVHGVKPDLTREGGSIPITSALEDSTGMNVLLLPIGACDDMAHSQNEKYNVLNYMNGIKVSLIAIVRPSLWQRNLVLNAISVLQVLGMYLHQIGKIKGPKPSQCKCVPLTDEELMVPGAFMKGFRCKCEI